MKKINLFLLLLLPLTVVRAAVIYVSPSGSGTNGSSWSTAYNTLNSALSASVSGDEIWVAQGTYTLVGSSSKLNFKDGVNVYGGFAGTEVSRAERSTNSSLTVISHETVLASNFRMLTSSDLTTRSIWDGFTFDGKNVGQGVLLAGNCELDNCVVKNCMTSNGSGAGVYMSAANSTLPVVLKDVELSNNRIKVSSTNTSPLGGAGVYVKNGTTLADINNCTIKNNTLEGISSTGTLEAMGAGIYIVEGTIRNCTLDQNVVMNSALSTYSHNNFTGGAIAIVPQNTSVPAKQVVVDKCVITNSSSNATGGAIIINPRWSGQYHGNYTFSNCIITNNKSNAVGGGIMATATPVQTGTGWTLNIINSVISNNSSTTNAGAGIYINIGCIVNITNSSIVKNKSGNYGGAGIFMQGVTHTIKPTFKNVIFWGNECPGRTADVVQIQTSSQPSIISNCAVQSYTPSSTQFVNATLTNNINLNADNVAVDGPNLIQPADTAGYGVLDALTADFSLSNLSPCLNAGTVSEATMDITNLARPQGESFDIGAFELQYFSTTVNIGSGGTVGSYNTGDIIHQPKGTKTTFSITPNSGMRILSVMYNGNDVKSQLINPVAAGGDFVTPELTSNSILDVTFEADNTTELENIPSEIHFSNSKNMLEIFGLIPESKLTIYNITGSKVVEKSVVSKNISIELQTGVYLIKANGKVRKVVVD